MKMAPQRIPRILIILAAGFVLTLPLVGWAQFDFTTNADHTVTVISYTGPGGNVTIPGITNGYPVTSIGDWAFSSQTTLTGVTLPDSVISIGVGAFANCSGLTNVTIPNGATSIGAWAFAGCSSLSSVTIPSSITCISNGLFSNCSGLIGVTIPNSVTNIGEDAFSYCSGLMNVTIPDNVLSIGGGAFNSCSGLLGVTLPDSVISIGVGAFANCSGLTNVTIGHSVTSIGSFAFASCTNLHAVYFQGNAPSVNGGLGSADSTVFHDESGTVYYVPGTSGWVGTFGGWPTAGWYLPQPQILGCGDGLSTQSNGFHFTISWATNTAVVVEASTNLRNWMPIITNMLVNGTVAVRDSYWTNYPQRFYRVRSP